MASAISKGQGTHGEVKGPMMTRSLSDAAARMTLAVSEKMVAG